MSAGDDDEARVRDLLAQTASFERVPSRDLAPAALKRVRLRGYGVTNANEFLNGFVHFFRGFAALFTFEQRPDERNIPRD